VKKGFLGVSLRSSDRLAQPQSGVSGHLVPDGWSRDRKSNLKQFADEKSALKSKSFQTL